MAVKKNHGLLEPGEAFGDYTVQKLLGRGGMGAVYLVRNSDGEQYAMKVMDADAAERNPDFYKRFMREAEIAIKIRHLAMSLRGVGIWEWGAATRTPSGRS